MEGAIDGKKAVGSLVEQLELANQETLKILQNFKAIENSARSFKTPSQGNQLVGQSDQAYIKANAAIKEQNRLLAALERQRARNNLVQSKVSIDLAKERVETQRLNRENKERAILQSKEIGAYRKLNLERSKAATTLRDLVASQKSSNEEIQKAQANFDALDKKVRKADDAVRDSTKNVGNYKSAFQGFRSIISSFVGVFGLIEGLKLGARFVKDSIDIARAAKGVEFAFERLGDTGEDAFNRVRKSTRGVVSELDIKTALVDFNNFNIDLKETDVLFEFLAVRAAQTGKSIDSLRDSLVEGLSKESKLRIDNLGISAGELNDELEKTPDFVQAVANIARREIAEAGNILGDAANEGEKLNASLENLQVQIGKFSEVTGIISFFADALQGSADVLEAQAASAELGGSALKSLVIELRSYTESGREANAQLVEEAKRRRESVKEIDAQTQAYIKLYGAVGPITQFQALGGSAGPTPFSLAPPPETPRLLADINAELEKQQDILADGEFSSRSEAKIIQDRIKVLEKEREAILGNDKDKKKTLAGTIARYTELIKKEKEVQQEQSTTKDVFDASQAKIDEYTQKISRLTGEFLKLEKIDISNVELSTDNIDFTKFVKSIGEGFKKAGLQFDLEFAASAIDLPENDAYEKLAEQAEFAYKRAEVAAEASGKRQREILQQTLLGAQEIYNIDLQGFVDILDKKEANLEDYAESSRETLLSVNDAILSGTLSRLDRERDEARHTLELIRSDAEASEEKRQQAEAEYRRKDLEIRKKQFKAEQKAAIARTIINTAVAIIQAYAQLGPIGGTIAGVLISALGTVQLAQIKSQKPPEFFRGKKSTDSFEGIGSVNELPGQREIGIDESGNLSLFPAGKHYRKIKRRDIIIPSMPEFERQIKDPTSDTFKRVSKKYGKDAERRIQLFHVKPEPMDTKPMEKMMERVMMKYANRPVHSHVTIKSQTKGYRV